MPGTKEAVVPCTVLLERGLFDELRALSEKFINPATIRPYGMAAIVRYCVAQGVKDLQKIGEDDLLDYLPKGKKGEVGRHAIGESTVKTVFPVQKSAIIAINKHLATLQNPIIGTTTYLRKFLKQKLGKVRLRDLYLSIPERHKDIMISEGYTPKLLLSMYQSSQD